MPLSRPHYPEIHFLAVIEKTTTPASNEGETRYHLLENPAPVFHSSADSLMKRSLASLSRPQNNQPSL